MKQLCTSKIDAGEYDSIISFMINHGLSDRTILHEIMNSTKGKENPSTVLKRIEGLRK